MNDGEPRYWRLFAFNNVDPDGAEWTVACHEGNLAERILRFARHKETVLVSRLEPSEVGWDSFGREKGSATSEG